MSFVDQSDATVFEYTKDLVDQGSTPKQAASTLYERFGIRFSKADMHRPISSFSKTGVEIALESPAPPPSPEVVMEQTPDADEQMGGFSPEGPLEEAADYMYQASQVPIGAAMGAVRAPVRPFMRAHYTKQYVGESSDKLEPLRSRAVDYLVDMGLMPRPTAESLADQDRTWFANHPSNVPQFAVDIGLADEGELAFNHGAENSPLFGAAMRYSRGKFLNALNTQDLNTLLTVHDTANTIKQDLAWQDSPYLDTYRALVEEVDKATAENKPFWDDMSHDAAALRESTVHLLAEAMAATEDQKVFFHAGTWHGGYLGRLYQSAATAEGFMAGVPASYHALLNRDWKMAERKPVMTAVLTIPVLMYLMKGAGLSAAASSMRGRIIAAAAKDPSLAKMIDKASSWGAEPVMVGKHLLKRRKIAEKGKKATHEPGLEPLTKGAALGEVAGTVGTGAMFGMPDVGLVWGGSRLGGRYVRSRYPNFADWLGRTFVHPLARESEPGKGHDIRETSSRVSRSNAWAHGMTGMIRKELMPEIYSGKPPVYNQALMASFESVLRGVGAEVDVGGKGVVTVKQPIKELIKVVMENDDIPGADKAKIADALENLSLEKVEEHFAKEVPETPKVPEAPEAPEAPEGPPSRVQPFDPPPSEAAEVVKDVPPERRQYKDRDIEERKDPRFDTPRRKAGSARHTFKDVTVEGTWKPSEPALTSERSQWYWRNFIKDTEFRVVEGTREVMLPDPKAPPQQSRHVEIQGPDGRSYGSGSSKAQAIFKFYETLKHMEHLPEGEWQRSARNPGDKSLFDGATSLASPEQQAPKPEVPSEVLPDEAAVAKFRQDSEPTRQQIEKRSDRERGLVVEANRLYEEAQAIQKEDPTKYVRLMEERDRLMRLRERSIELAEREPRSGFAETAAERTADFGEEAAVATGLLDEIMNEQQHRDYQAGEREMIRESLKEHLELEGGLENKDGIWIEAPDSNLVNLWDLYQMKGVTKRKFPSVEGEGMTMAEGTRKVGRSKMESERASMEANEVALLEDLLNRLTDEVIKEQGLGQIFEGWEIRGENPVAPIFSESHGRVGFISAAMAKLGVPEYITKQGLRPDGTIVAESTLANTIQGLTGGFKRAYAFETPPSPRDLHAQLRRGQEPHDVAEVLGPDIAETQGPSMVEQRLAGETALTPEAAKALKAKRRAEFDEANRGPAPPEGGFWGELADWKKLSEIQKDAVKEKWREGERRRLDVKWEEAQILEDARLEEAAAERARKGATKETPDEAHVRSREKAYAEHLAEMESDAGVLGKQTEKVSNFSDLAASPKRAFTSTRLITVKDRPRLFYAVPEVIGGKRSWTVINKNTGIKLLSENAKSMKDAKAAFTEMLTKQWKRSEKAPKKAKRRPSTYTADTALKQWRKLLPREGILTESVVAFMRKKWFSAARRQPGRFSSLRHTAQNIKRDILHYYLDAKRQGVIKGPSRTAKLFSDLLEQIEEQESGSARLETLVSALSKEDIVGLKRLLREEIRDAQMFDVMDPKSKSAFALDAAPLMRKLEKVHAETKGGITLKQIKDRIARHKGTDVELAALRAFEENLFRHGNNDPLAGSALRPGVKTLSDSIQPPVDLTGSPAQGASLTWYRLRNWHSMPPEKPGGPKGPQKVRNITHMVGELVKLEAVESAKKTASYWRRKNPKVEIAYDRDLISEPKRLSEKPGKVPLRTPHYDPRMGGWTEGITRGLLRTLDEATSNLRRFGGMRAKALDAFTHTLGALLSEAPQEALLLSPKLKEALAVRITDRIADRVRGLTEDHHRNHVEGFVEWFNEEFRRPFVGDTKGHPAILQSVLMPLKVKYREGPKASPKSFKVDMRKEMLEAISEMTKEERQVMELEAVSSMIETLALDARRAANFQARKSSWERAGITGTENFLNEESRVSTGLMLMGYRFADFQTLPMGYPTSVKSIKNMADLLGGRRREILDSIAARRGEPLSAADKKQLVGEVPKGQKESTYNLVDVNSEVGITLERLRKVEREGYVDNGRKVSPELDGALKSFAEDIVAEIPEDIYRQMDPEGQGFAVDPGWNDYVGWELTTHRELGNMEGLLRRITWTMKAHLTVLNPLTHIGNALGNISAIAGLSGETPMGVVYRTVKTNLAFMEYAIDPGNFTKLDKSKYKSAKKYREAVAGRELLYNAFEAMKSTNLHEATLVRQEMAHLLDMTGSNTWADGTRSIIGERFGVLNRPAKALEAAAKRVHKANRWVSRKAAKAYNFEDVSFKVAEFVREYTEARKILLEAPDLSETGFRTSNDGRVWFRKEKDAQGVTRYYFPKDPAVAAKEVASQLDMAPLDRRLAAAAAHKVHHLVFDYSNVPNWVRYVRDNALFTIFSPFVTWTWKAIDLPGKRGLFSNVLMEQPLVSSSDPAVMSAAFARTHRRNVRRALMLSGAMGLLEEDHDYYRRTSRYGREPLGYSTALTERATDPGYIRTFRLTNSDIFEPSMIAFRNFLGAATMYSEARNRVLGVQEEDLLGGIASKAQKQGMILDVKSLLRMSQLSGGPLSEYVMMEVVGRNEWGGHISASDRWRKLGPALIGSLWYRSADAMTGIVNPESEYTSRRHEVLTRQEYSTYGRDQIVRDNIAWIFRSITGLGWRHKNFEKRGNEIISEVSQNLTASLIAPLKKEMSRKDKAGDTEGAMELGRMINLAKNSIVEEKERLQFLLSERDLRLRKAQVGWKETQRPKSIKRKDALQEMFEHE